MAGVRLLSSAGRGDATTLLAHGSLSNAGEWALVAPHLDRRVVAVDWPGAGLTPPVHAKALAKAM